MVNGQTRDKTETNLGCRERAADGILPGSPDAPARTAPLRDQCANALGSGGGLTADLMKASGGVALRWSPNVDDGDRILARVQHSRGHTRGELLVLPDTQRIADSARRVQLAAQVFSIRDRAIGVALQLLRQDRGPLVGSQPGKEHLAAGRSVQRQRLV